MLQWEFSGQACTKEQNFPRKMAFSFKRKTRESKHCSKEQELMKTPANASTCMTSNTTGDVRTTYKTTFATTAVHVCMSIPWTGDIFLIRCTQMSNIILCLTKMLMVDNNCITASIGEVCITASFLQLQWLKHLLNNPSPDWGLLNLTWGARCDCLSGLAIILMEDACASQLDLKGFRDNFAPESAAMM